MMWKPNMYLSQKLYNEDFKKRFLNESDYEKGTQRYYEYVFKKSYDIEKVLKKDIYNFNVEELDSLIKSYPNSSTKSVQGVLTVLRKYISFAIQEGFVENKINYLQAKSSTDDVKKYLNLNKIKSNFVSEEEMQEICDSCENAQDAICFALPFYGVKGSANSEIIELKVKDVNFTGRTIKVGDREFKINDWLAELIFEATEETMYVKSNGKETDTKVGHISLNENDYVLRTGGKKNNEPANHLVVNSRIRRIGDFLWNNKLTPTSIWYSGLYNEYLKIKNTKGEVTKDDYEALCERFGYNKEYYWNIKSKMETLNNIVG